MKKCSKCKETKPAQEFYAGRPDCKACKRALSRKNYSENREHYVAYSRKYREDNYQQTLETARRYRAAHLAERREYEANYHREKLAARSERVKRIKTLIEHFKDRPRWLEILATAIVFRKDAHGLCWISADVDDLLRVHFYRDL
jgi:hypothetical protein